MQQLLTWFLSLVLAFFSSLGLNFGTLNPSTTTAPQPFTPALGMEQTFSYGSSDDQNLDLFLPHGKQGDVGLILFLHGGAWVSGMKETYTLEAKKWQLQGYATASINYRFLGAGVLFSDQLDDITAALNAIKLTAEYNGQHLTKMVLVGNSAGGHLALLYAYTRGAESPVPPVAVVSSSAPTDFTDAEFIRSSDVVQAVITNLGLDPAFVADALDSGLASMFLPVLDRISPAKQVTATSVPTLMAHGMQDTVVPYSNALRLDSALTAAGVKHDFVSFPNAGHALTGDAANTARFQTLAAQYIATYLR